MTQFRKFSGGWSRCVGSPVTLLAVLIWGVAPSKYCVAKSAKGSASSVELPADWPASVAGFVPAQSSEHPRLLFRKSELAHLRERAENSRGTSDHQAIAGSAQWLRWRVNANGFLYQLTGDKKYADLGRQCMGLALDGQRDRDRRYSFRAPFGALRAGPSIGWYALGYDLCYDGWDEDYRKKVAQAFADYNEGKWMTLAELAEGKRQFPGSNHWGMEVGGAALALLAVMNDPGVDMAKITPLLEASQRCMVRNMTEGFGDGGFFAEGDGTGSMSSHIAFLPALQAWRIAAGKDFITPRPNAQWMAMKWIFLSVPKESTPPHDWFWPQRGAYPHNIWSRNDKSGGGYFSIGMGVGNAEQKSALLWFYNHCGLKAQDEKDGTFLDTPSPYPNHSILSFANWPLGVAEKNPGDVLSHAYRDAKWGFYAWRNRWQDENDTVITILTKPTKGNYGCKAENALSIESNGKRFTWGHISGGFTGDYQPAKDGSTVLACGDGSSLAIDFSKASGADALIVIAGPSASASKEGQVLEAGGTKFSVLAVGNRDMPKPQSQGDKLSVGGQTISFDGKSIVLGK